jgi:hypothetical protein
MPASAKSIITAFIVTGTVLAFEVGFASEFIATKKI